MNDMRQKKMLLIAAAAAILVSCGSKGSMKFGDNEYPVRTVGTQDAALESSYPATIKGIQDVEIRPKVSGFITEVRVKEGQTVGAGQVLFVIDNVTYQAAVRQAKAAVNTATAALNTAKLTYENSKKLYESNIIGNYELQSAQNSYESAVAQLAQANASLASAEENLSYCYVKSPANGVVGSLPYKVGALVSASSASALTTVSDINTVEVYFSMTEKDVLELAKSHEGMAAAISAYPPVKFLLATGEYYDQEGKVVKASGVIDPSTGSTQMIAHFANPKHLLKSGSSGSIVIPHTATDAIVIPQEAVSQVQDKYFVYIVGADNKVSYTEVTIDPNDDGKNYIITSGLKKGDRIVVKGITSLTDGMEITPLTEAQYAEKLAKATAMGADQSDLSKLKEDFK